MRCTECTAELPEEARFCLSCGARVHVPQHDAPADRLLEALRKALGFQYRIERLLGRGGMGAVYLAHELALDRDVAIKVLPPEHASAPDVRERFRFEARTAARLTHPNIVPLHTFGEVDGLMYFVMGYVCGESLAARLDRERRLDSETARLFLASICDALAYAHRQGVVHRDIKPDNILIDAETGAPHLTDFGIAKATLGDSQLTTAGTLMGTPHYMSPEQALGRSDIDARSDVYSLGVVGYEMLTGRRPFEGDNPIEVLAQRLTKAPTPLASIAADVAPDLSAALMRCLQREPADRWPDARQFAEVLMPSEEEEEYAPPLRILNTAATLGLPGLVVAGAGLGIISWLYPGSQEVWRRLASGYVGFVFAMLMVCTIAIVRLRRAGQPVRAMLRDAVRQPRWWRGWYPRAGRRPGDMWDRIPVTVKRYRTVKSLLLAYTLTMFLPIMVLTMWRGTSWLYEALLAFQMIGIATMLRLRHTAVVTLPAAAAANSLDAASLVNTPTWRVATWRKALATPARGSRSGAGGGGTQSIASVVEAAESPGSELPTLRL